MPLILSGNVASATAGAYEVKNSCRFGTDTYMDKDNSASSPTHADKYTISFWCKKCQTSGGGSGAPAEDGYTLFISSGSGTNGDLSDHYCQIYFKNDDDIRWQEYDDGTSGQLETNQVFRDPAAWYHLVFRFDSTDGTADDRMRIYVNGTQVTSFQTRTNIDQNTDSWVNYASAGHRIGGGGTRHFDGYLAEFVLVDGQSLAPTEFGEFDEDSPTIWKPKNVSGLTFGTHGYYLDFETSGTLGNDANGGTDFSVTNLAAVDQTTDSPTNNFATMNPLANLLSNPGVFSEGNLKIVAGGSWCSYTSTIGVNKGKWYAEAKLAASAASAAGILSENTLNTGNGTSDYGIRVNLGAGNQYQGIGYHTEGYKYPGSGADRSSYGTSYATDAIIGIALNLDDEEVTFYEDNTSHGAISITTGNEFWFFSCSHYSSGDSWEMNFGNPPYANSSDAADENGYGKFEFSPPAGFLALCTKNLGSDGG